MSVEEQEQENEMKPKSKLDVALIGIVLTLIVQMATAIWWAATMDSRVHQLELDTAPLKGVPADVRVLGVQMENLNTNLGRVTDKLEKLGDGK